MSLSKADLEIGLIKSHQNTITCKDILNALYELNIKNGDTICVHSQLFSLGMPLVSRELYLNYLVKLLRESIGTNGTLIMPTFTYSFCRNEIYDIQCSPSTVGILTEYFRCLPSVKRTNHPIFSFAVLGPRVEEFLNIGPDAFSMDSVYGKMLESNDKLVMLGAPKGYTFYYLSEQYTGVTHRYFKKFSGIIVDGNTTYEATIPYYVRHLDMKSIEDENKVDIFLNEQNIQKNVLVGRGSISSVSTQDMFQACTDKLKLDEQFFLED